MTSPFANARQGNQMMIERIRQMPPEPFTEGRYVLRIVGIAGRSSGTPRYTPLAVIQSAGDLYLIAPTAERDWVANLTSAGTCTLGTRDGEVHYQAVRTADEHAQQAALRYRQLLGDGFSANQYPFGPNATAEEVAQKIASMGVFRLTPA